MNWLFATTSPWPMTNGTALRVWHLCRGLADAGHELTLATNCPLDGYEQAYAGLGIRVVRVHSDDSSTSETGRWRLWPYPQDNKLAEAVAAESVGKDIVVLASAAALQYALQAAQAEVVVADIIDDPVLAIRRRAGAGGRLHMRIRRMRMRTELKRYESKCLPHVSAVTFVSDADRDSFQSRHRSAAVFTIPNGVDVDYFAPPRQPPAADTSPPRVLFVGNYGFPPNRIAASFLVDQVAPLVWAKHPETVFQFVGPDPTAKMRAWTDTRIEVTGMVDDVRTYLHGATAAAIAMLTGTGIKNKLLEAWAAGVCVVATPLACQGVDSRPDENVLVGEGAEGYAHALGRAIADSELRQAIAAAGRTTACERFNWSRMSEEICRVATKMIAESQHA